MINKNFKEAIKIIHQLMSENKIKWALIGSTNMQLQGIDIVPNDLDIVIQLKDLEKMREIFSEYNVSAVKELKPLSHIDTRKLEFTFEIDNLLIQVIGEIEKGLYINKLLSNRFKKIKIDDIEIPCFALEAEAQTYAEINRKHKAHLIQEYLKRA